MHAVTQFVVSLSTVVAAGSLIVISRNLHQLRRLMETRRLFALNEGELRATSADGKSLSSESAAGFAIYVFRDGRWHLEADLSTPGYEATPPGIPGRFEGQVVRKDSVFKE